MRRTLAALLTLPALAVQSPAPTPAELLQAAKSAWTTQGDREGASAKFEQVLALLDAKADALDPTARRILCEAYNWLAVLDDRSPSQKARVPRHFEAILNLDPNFGLDRTITPGRLVAQFDADRDARFPRLDVSVQPEGGTLLVDGRPATPGVRRLPVGTHVFRYQRPGYKAVETNVDLQISGTPPLRIELSRIASTLSFNVHPIGAEILLDGKSLGKASGLAGPEARPWAEKAGIPLDTLSAPFQVEEVLPGKHRLEVRGPCHVARRIDIPEDFTTPLADHVLDPIKLESSAAKLTLVSGAKGGEAFLDGSSLGPLPLSQSPICPGSHLLVVRFPAGGFSRTLDVKDGENLSLTAVPKPRMAFLGLEGDADFPGRARLEARFQELAGRLAEVAFLPQRAGENPEDARARLLAGKEAELILEARIVARGGVNLVEVRLSTPEGLDEQFVVKPLDQDPLEALVARLNAPLLLTEPSLGLVCLELPGEPGPWVLQASEAALKAGLQLHQPITAVQGQTVSNLREFRQALAKLPDGPTTLTQGGASISLPLFQTPLELPFRSARLSYPRVLAELRLRLLAAKGTEVGVVRLNLARALLHFEKADRALEVLREATLAQGPGVSQGNIAYLTGICLQRLGSVYIPEAIQAFNQALQDPGARLLGPEGPPIAPLARAALQSIQP